MNGRDTRHAHVALLVIAVVFFAVEIPLALSGRSLTWDSAVYASHFGADVPPLPYSAARSLGMPLLLAPVTLITSSVPAINLYLAAATALGLYLSFRPWLRLLPGWSTPLAAGWFAGLWTTLAHGVQAYPNIWLALALVGGAGLLLRGLREPSWRAWAGVVVVFALATLIRPTDATIATAPVFVGLVAVPDWRRWVPALSVGAGLAVGWGTWVVEAFARFGDPVSRMSAASSLQNPEVGVYWLRHLRAADGPYLYCGADLAPCSDINWPEVVWWLALPALVLAVLVAIRRHAVFPGLLVVGASAAAVAAPYLFYFPVSNPRFLEPAFALASLPLGYAFARLSRTQIGAAIVTVGLLFHFTMQGTTLGRVTNVNNDVRNRIAARAEVLADSGIDGGCLIVGPGAMQLAFLLKCRARPLSAGPGPNNRFVQQAVTSGATVVAINDAASSTDWPGWRRITTDDHGGFHAFVKDAQ